MSAEDALIPTSPRKRGEVSSCVNLTGARSKFIFGE